MRLVDVFVRLLDVFRVWWMFLCVCWMFCTFGGCFLGMLHKLSYLIVKHSLLEKKSVNVLICTR